MAEHSGLDRLRDRLRSAGSPLTGIVSGGEFRSWSEIWDDANSALPALVPGATYLIDSDGRHDAVSALLAVFAVSATKAVWGSRSMMKQAQPTRLANVYTLPTIETPTIDDSAWYGTLTSGSTGVPKIPMGIVDDLITSGYTHESAIYADFLPPPTEGGALATCLRPDYVAPFLMTLVPAMVTGRNVVMLDFSNFSALFAQLEREPVALLCVPALLSALSAYAAGHRGIRCEGLTVICTGGHLSSARIEHARRFLPEAKFCSTYGSSEYGTLTFNSDAKGERNVGHPLRGKPVWIADPAPDGTGRVVTYGQDCRVFYAYNHQPLLDQEGVALGTDFGHFDDLGRLVLDSRIDGAIKINGILVRTRDIEHHILKLPCVADVRIRVRQADDAPSDLLEALVVGDVSESELVAHCAVLPSGHRPTLYAIQQDNPAAYSIRGKL